MQRILSPEPARAWPPWNRRRRYPGRRPRSRSPQNPRDTHLPPNSARRNRTRGRQEIPAGSRVHAGIRQVRYASCDRFRRTPNRNRSRGDSPCAAPAPRGELPGLCGMRRHRALHAMVRPKHLGAIGDLDRLVRLLFRDARRRKRDGRADANPASAPHGQTLLPGR